MEKNPRKHKDEVASVRVTWEHKGLNKITGTIPNQKTHRLFTLLIINFISHIMRRKTDKFTHWRSDELGACGLPYEEQRTHNTHRNLLQREMDTCNKNWGNW